MHLTSILTSRILHVKTGNVVIPIPNSLCCPVLYQIRREQRMKQFSLRSLPLGGVSSHV